MAHTQGTWTIDPAELIDDEQLERATIYAPVPGTPYHSIVALVFCENRKGATIGPNARLIAAAPDLLHACKAALIYADQLEKLYRKEEDYQMLDILRAAIAKAEGA